MLIRHPQAIRESLQAWRRKVSQPCQQPHRWWWGCASMTCHRRALLSVGSPSLALARWVYFSRPHVSNDAIMSMLLTVECNRSQVGHIPCRFC